MKQSLINISCLVVLFSMVIICAHCSPSPGDQKPQTHQVEIVGMKFQPAELTVNKGDTVIFTNKDILTHNVTEQNNKKWASPPMQSQQSYKMAVNESAEYYCSFHPVMKGKLVVK